MSEKTKQSRSWLLTVPAKDYDREYVEEALSNYAYMGQLEEGKSGYRHWQILIENPHAIRFTTLKNLIPKAHIEPRAGSLRQAAEYVTKEDSRVEGEPPLENGRIVITNEQGRRKDVEVIREAILEENKSVDQVLLDFPEAARMQAYVRELVSARDRRNARGIMRDVEVIYLYGEPGTGKTHWVYANFPDLYRVTDYNHPYDSYDAEDVLVLDEFTGQLGLTDLNNLLDVYPLQLPARYANRTAMFTKVVMISNLPPWTLYNGHPDILRRAFIRRVDRVLLMDEGKPVEVLRELVLSKFGVEKPREQELQPASS